MSSSWVSCAAFEGDLLRLPRLDFFRWDLFLLIDFAEALPESMLPALEAYVLFLDSCFPFL